MSANSRAIAGGTNSVDSWIADGCAFISCAGGIVLALTLRIDEEMSQGALSERPREGWTVAQRYVLRRPEGKILDDALYDDDAHAYMSAVALGLSPNKTIAADVGAQLSTVAAWVSKARRLGYLPPGERGRVTA